MTRVFSLRGATSVVAPIVPHAVTPPLLPPIIPHAEVLFLPLSYSQISAAISTDVHYEGSGAVQLGHDMGHMIPHVPYGPPTPILALHIASSQCSCIFGKASILVNGEQAAWWHALAMFQVCADPVPMPLGLNISAIATTVSYGFSWGDLICGYIRGGIDELNSLLVGKLFSVRPIRAAQEKYVEFMARRLYPHIKPTLAKARLSPAVIKFLDGKIRDAIKDAPKDLADYLSAELVDRATSDRLRELSIAIDEHLADTPPPTSAPSPISALLDPVPVLTV